MVIAGIGTLIESTKFVTLLTISLVFDALYQPPLPATAALAAARVFPEKDAFNILSV